MREGVADDHDLRERPELVEESARTLEGLERRDGVLDLGKLEAMLVKYVKTVLHELVVVGLFACGARQLRNVARIGELDPDFRNEHSLQVKTNDVHGHDLLS